MFKHTNDMEYEVLVECYGIATCRCGNGIFLTLDNGEKAYACRFGNLYPGDKVICCVDKLPHDGKHMQVSISRVCHNHTRAA